MELKESLDSIVSEQERQNRMIGNLMSDNTHLKSQWIRYDPERQEIRQCDAINELKRVSRTWSVYSFYRNFRTTRTV